MLNELLWVMALCAPAAAISLFIAWRWKFFAPTDRPRAKITGTRLCWALAIAAAGQIIIPALLTRVLPHGSFVIALLMPLLIIPALAWLAWHHYPKSHRPVRQFFLGVACWAVAAPSSALLAAFIGLVFYLFGLPIEVHQAPVDFLIQLGNRPLLLSVALFAMIFLIPVLEEQLFRGFLQSWLRRHLSAQPAILISAAAFAVMHYAESQALANFILIPSIFVVGYFLGHLYEHQGSLYAPIGLHMTYNLLGSLSQVF